MVKKRSLALSLLLLTPMVPSVAGCATTTLTCTEVAATGDGLTIARGLVAGTMHVSCTPEPDTYDITIVLVHNGVTLKPGTTRNVLPTAAGYDISTFSECAPGVWHIFYLVTLTYQGQTAHNTTTTTPDRTVTDGDCRAHGG
jgi:hypothetical protein